MQLGEEEPYSSLQEEVCKLNVSINLWNMWVRQLQRWWSALSARRESKYYLFLDQAKTRRD